MAGKRSGPKVTTELEAIKDILRITPDLDMEMTRQAALYSQFAIAAVLAEDEMDRYKHQLAIFEAKADKPARARLIQMGEKVTEALVTATIHQRAEWNDLNIKILDAKRDKGILSAAARAFDQRAVMLSGLSATRRTEMGVENASASRSMESRTEKATKALQKGFAKRTGRPNSGGDDWS